VDSASGRRKGGGRKEKGMSEFANFISFLHNFTPRRTVGIAREGRRGERKVEVFPKRRGHRPRKTRRKKEEKTGEKAGDMLYVKSTLPIPIATPRRREKKGKKKKEKKKKGGGSPLYPPTPVKRK